MGMEILALIVSAKAHREPRRVRACNPEEVGVVAVIPLLEELHASKSLELLRLWYTDEVERDVRLLQNSQICKCAVVAVLSAVEKLKGGPLRKL